MKQNQQRLMALLTQAIQACGEDGALSGAKANLRNAIAITQKVSKKRLGRETQRQAYEEIAKKKNAAWWQMIKDNVVSELPPPSEETN
jgi:hypothetical protein